MKEVKTIWNECIWKKSTIISLVIIYLGIFEHDTISQLWKNLIGNDIFMNAAAIWLSGYFFRSTK
ncbi:MAG: hypothetical protein IPP65_13225 [Chlorobi bacterium]|nr:hypothetical protein [Chlorobiota bacterium]